MREKQSLAQMMAPLHKDEQSDLTLDDGSRVAVIGGGPAGSFTSYFLLDMAQRAGIRLEVDIYEPRDFSTAGPAGCNMCGGIISESLVQILATEGITLPPTVVQRGIDSYVLHTDVGTVRIETGLRESRIAAVHRGGGPRGTQRTRWSSFDEFLLNAALSKGATLIPARVTSVTWQQGRPHVAAKERPAQPYDLLVAAFGVNAAAGKLFDDLGLAYRPPQTTRTYIEELCLGEEAVEQHLGSSMHVFLLNIPRLEFAALIPKGDCVTLCLLGRDIDKALIAAFHDAPEVKGCLPPDWHQPDRYCHCSPQISVHGAVQPFADRLVFVGDCGVTRLYKDGIGAAYRIAKAAARTAIFSGVSARDFRRHFQPTCTAIEKDNRIGKLVFAATALIQKLRFARRSVVGMVRSEQRKPVAPRMSAALWNLFTGSAPYREILLRMCHPFFWSRLLLAIGVGFRPRSRSD